MATAGADTRRAPAIGVRGLLLIVAGTALVVAADRRLTWYQVGGGADTASEATFASLRNSVDQVGGARAAEIYFHWLSWTLLIAVIALGALANVETPITGLMRILGFVAGAAGVGATYYALLQYTDVQAQAGAIRHNPLFNGSWGLLAALGGFGLTALGAGLGPRKDG